MGLTLSGRTLGSWAEPLVRGKGSSEPSLGSWIPLLRTSSWFANPEVANLLFVTEVRGWRTSGRTSDQQLVEPLVKGVYFQDVTSSQTYWNFRHENWFVLVSVLFGCCFSLFSLSPSPVQSSVLGYCFWKHHHALGVLLVWPDLALHPWMIMSPNPDTPSLRFNSLWLLVFKLSYSLLSMFVYS